MIHLLQTKTKKFVIQERINCAKKEHKYTLPSMLEKLQPCTEQKQISSRSHQNLGTNTLHTNGYAQI